MMQFSFFLVSFSESLGSVLFWGSALYAQTNFFHVYKLWQLCQAAEGKIYIPEFQAEDLHVRLTRLSLSQYHAQLFQALVIRTNDLDKENEIILIGLNPGVGLDSIPCKRHMATAYRGEMGIWVKTTDSIVYYFSFFCHL